jgi:hypothetical protein
MCPTDARPHERPDRTETMLKTPHLVLLALFLGACAPRLATAPATITAIDLAPILLVEVEPAVRESCEASIHQALLRRGLILDAGGPRVEVEVSFWQDPGLGSPTGDYPDEMGSPWTSASTIATSRRTGYTADVTATIHEGRASRKVMSSGTADRTEQVQSRWPTGGPSRISACSIAADRLADAMMEVMHDGAR